MWIVLALTAPALADDASKPSPPTDSPAPTSTTASAEVKVGTGVANHEISGESATFPVDTTVWVWSKVKDAEPSIKHVWKKDGQAVWTATMPVGSKEWSTNSRRKLGAGSYSVDVQTADGASIGTVSFTVQ